MSTSKRKKPDSSGSEAEKSTKRNLTFKERIEIIKAHQVGCSQASLALQYSKSPAAISKTIRDKDRTLQMMDRNFSLKNLTREPKGHFPLLDEALYRWYCAASKNPVCISLFVRTLYIIDEFLRTSRLFTLSSLLWHAISLLNSSRSLQSPRQKNLSNFGPSNAMTVLSIGGKLA